MNPGDAASAVNSASTPATGNEGEGSTDYNTYEDDHKPLPLSDFAAYRSLVATLYRTSVPVILGNSLEWLDFGIYGYSSTEISGQLFGGSRRAYWASFGLGFASRPVGALVLGKLADETSRKLSFAGSVLAMSGSTALMAAIPAVCGATGPPSYSSSASWYCVSNPLAASVPAVVLRCVQGFSAGAAAGNANVLQSELWSTTDRKGAIAQAVGVQNASGGTASVLAAGLVYGLRAAVGEDAYAVWGWRLAMVAVLPLGLAAGFLVAHGRVPESDAYADSDGGRTMGEGGALLLRRGGGGEDDDDDARPTIELSESRGGGSGSSEHEVLGEDTPFHFTGGGARKDPPPRRPPSGEAGLLVATHATPWWLLVSVLVVAQSAIAGFNNLGVFLVEFAQTDFGATAGMATLMQVAGKTVQVLSTPLAAGLADTRGCFWTCALGGTLCTFLALPLMVAGRLGGIAGAWVLVAGCLPVVSTLWIGNAPLLATSLFPTSCRSRGTGLVLAAAAGIQGFLPLALERIGNPYAQGAALTVLAAVGTLGILWIRGEAAAGRVTVYQRPELC